jgi:CMP-N,N'-diacetyllegionaminic acid synthase
MIGPHAVLAMVLARSGSRGIADKNLRIVGGQTLIARAAETLRCCTTVDAAMISTDSQAYSEEGVRHGLDAWFLRPPELSSDGATAVDTAIHALLEAEQHYRRHFEITLIIEPTSPLRRPEDIDACVQLLVESDAESVVAVSPVDVKFHPKKLLRIEMGELRHYDAQGPTVTARQQLDTVLYFRNGVCYAVRRNTLVDDRRIFAERTLPFVIHRPIVNIDEPFELELAEFLLQREQRGKRT